MELQKASSLFHENIHPSPLPHKRKSSFLITDRKPDWRGLESHRYPIVLVQSS